jgi:hypothetical protein
VTLIVVPEIEAAKMAFGAPVEPILIETISAHTPKDATPE